MQQDISIARETARRDAFLSQYSNVPAHFWTLPSVKEALATRYDAHAERDLRLIYVLYRMHLEREEIARKRREELESLNIHVLKTPATRTLPPKDRRKPDNIVQFRRK
jgi:hypothetical protein